MLELVWKLALARQLALYLALALALAAAVELGLELGLALSSQWLSYRLWLWSLLEF